MHDRPVLFLKVCAGKVKFNYLHVMLFYDT
jgi:hypothetical protein